MAKEAAAKEKQRADPAKVQGERCPSMTKLKCGQRMTGPTAVIFPRQLHARDGLLPGAKQLKKKTSYQVQKGRDGLALHRDGAEVGDGASARLAEHARVRQNDVGGHQVDVDVDEVVSVDDILKGQFLR